jgi:hypothetical protein
MWQAGDWRADARVEVVVAASARVRAVKGRRERQIAGQASGTGGRGIQPEAQREEPDVEKRGE